MKSLISVVLLFTTLSWSIANGLLPANSCSEPGIYTQVDQEPYAFPIIDVADDPDPWLDGGKVTISLDGNFLVATIKKAEKKEVNGLLDDSSLAGAKKRMTKPANELTATATKPKVNTITLCSGETCPELKQWQLVPITEKDQVRGHNLVSLDIPGMLLSYDEYNGLRLVPSKGDRPSVSRSDLWIIKSATGSTDRNRSYNIIPISAQGMALHADLGAGSVKISALVDIVKSEEPNATEAVTKSRDLIEVKASANWKIQKVVD